MPARPAAFVFLALLTASPAAAQQARPPARDAAPPAAGPQRLAPNPAGPAAPRRWSLADRDNMEIGVGLFSVGGHFARERGARGREPLVEPGGRQSRVAAVGFSLRF